MGVGGGGRRLESGRGGGPEVRAEGRLGYGDLFKFLSLSLFWLAFRKERMDLFEMAMGGRDRLEVQLDGRWLWNGDFGRRRARHCSSP